jgi:hypothetical protein
VNGYREVLDGVVGVLCKRQEGAIFEDLVLGMIDPFGNDHFLPISKEVMV